MTSLGSILLFVVRGGGARPLLQTVQWMVPSQLQAPAVPSVLTGHYQVSGEASVPLWDETVPADLTTISSPESTCRLLQPLSPAVTARRAARTSKLPGRDIAHRLADSETSLSPLSQTQRKALKIS